MPLIDCPDCKRQVSDKAASCIHCGCPLLRQVYKFVQIEAGNPFDWCTPPPGIDKIKKLNAEGWEYAKKTDPIFRESYYRLLADDVGFFKDKEGNHKEYHTHVFTKFVGPYDPTERITHETWFEGST